VSPLLAQEFPNTAGYLCLALAVSLLRQAGVMRLLVGHGDFEAVMEGLLARKSPSPKDLQVRAVYVALGFSDAYHPAAWKHKPACSVMDRHDCACW
jgi:hypothetical protein